MAKRGRKPGLASMSVDALFKLRDDVAKALTNRTVELQRQIAALGGSTADIGKRTSKAKGRKVAAKYRSKKDPKLTWSGRGMTPKWMTAEMKGTKLKKENFAIK